MHKARLINLTHRNKTNGNLKQKLHQKTYMTIEKWGGQVVSPIHKPNRLIFYTYKELLTVNINKTENKKEMNRWLTEKEMQMTLKHIKK